MLQMSFGAIPGRTSGSIDCPQVDANGVCIKGAGGRVLMPAWTIPGHGGVRPQPPYTPPKGVYQPPSSSAPPLVFPVIDPAQPDLPPVIVPETPTAGTTVTPVGPAVEPAYTSSGPMSAGFLTPAMIKGIIAGLGVAAVVGIILLARSR